MIRIMQASEFLANIVVCYPILKLKLHNLNHLPSLLLALYIWNFFQHCSVFKVQFSPVSLETRYKYSILTEHLYLFSNGGDNRNRTDDPLLAKQVLSQLSYTPIALKKVVGPSGLEPPTSRLSVVRSSQLSYGPMACTL